MPRLVISLAALFLPVLSEVVESIRDDDDASGLDYARSQIRRACFANRPEGIRRFGEAGAGSGGRPPLRAVRPHRANLHQHAGDPDAPVRRLCIGIIGLLFTPRQEDPKISVPMIDIFVQLPGRLRDAGGKPGDRAAGAADDGDSWRAPRLLGHPARRSIVTVRFLVGEDDGPVDRQGPRQAAVEHRPHAAGCADAAGQARSVSTMCRS